VKNLLKKNPKYSKRINYEALKDLFVDGASSPSGATPPSFQQMVRGMRGGDDKDDDGLYVFPEDERGQSMAPGGRRMAMDRDGKDDSEMLLIVEEDGAVPPPPPMGGGKRADEKDDHDVDMDEEDEDAEGDVVGGWEDGYEQEV
jgi:transcription factor IIIB subunit 2